MPQEMPPAAYILCFQASFKTSVSSVLLKAFLFLCLVLSCSGVTDFSNIICFFATRIVSSPFSRHLCLRQQQAAAFGASSLSSAQINTAEESVSLKWWGRILCWVDFSLFALYCIPKPPLWWAGSGVPEERAKQSFLLGIRYCLAQYKAYSTHISNGEQAPYTTGKFYEHLNRCNMWYFKNIL